MSAGEASLEGFASALEALGREVREAMGPEDVRYVEHRSAWASYVNSFRYLLRLSWPERRGQRA